MRHRDHFDPIRTLSVDEAIRELLKNVPSCPGLEERPEAWKLSNDSEASVYFTKESLS